jgi:hypothetical protein
MNYEKYQLNMAKKVVIECLRTLQNIRHRDGTVEEITEARGWRDLRDDFIDNIVNECIQKIKSGEISGRKK